MSSIPHLASRLPSIDRLLSHSFTRTLLLSYSRERVIEALRATVDDLRSKVLAGFLAEIPVDDAIVALARDRLTTPHSGSLRRVINATGVVLHTNLGRAVLGSDAIQAVMEAAGACNLEFDLESGKRGDRDAAVEEHLCALTGAEAATVVTNNAAAILLAVNSFAQGREVIVSRGELIEIGGSFRIPEILEKSGALLREVGTTNRTHAKDYEGAINNETALLLKVHTSNFRIVGFTADVELSDLVTIGASRNVPVMEDLGSGALLDLSVYGLPKEPIVRERIAAGADVVAFSGDKLLGGPQAGILVGRRAAIELIRRNPLKRALRCDKLILAALEATLHLYRTAPDLPIRIPTLRALTRPLPVLEELGRAAVLLLQESLAADYVCELVESEAEVGSGALPTHVLPSRAIAVTHPTIGPGEISATFRSNHPPIIGRVHDGRFLLDLRCIDDPAMLVPAMPSSQVEDSQRPTQ